MNRLRLGLLLLAVILVISIIIGLAIGNIHTQIADAMLAAADGIDIDLAFQTEALWQRFRGLTAAFTDHEPLEELDQLFSQLSRESAIAQPAEFSMLCIQASCVSRAIAESVELTWWNFL